MKTWAAHTHTHTHTHAQILIQSVWSGFWKPMFVCKFLHVILIIEESVAGSIVEGIQVSDGTVELYDF